MYTLINFLFWCWFISLHETRFILRQLHSLGPPKVSGPEIYYPLACSTGWSSYSNRVRTGLLPIWHLLQLHPIHPLVGCLETLAISTYPALVVRDRAQDTEPLTPRTESLYWELKVDSDSKNLVSLFPGWEHVDDLGNRGRWWGGIENGHSELLESKAQSPQPGWGHQQSGTFLQGNLSDSYHAAGETPRWPQYPTLCSTATGRPYSLNSIQLW